MMMDRFLPRKDDFPKEIHKAMRHTLFAGGKRVRPYLTIMIYLLFRKKLTEEVVKAATSVELLHTYTLIHDDLPEIDNDDYRRGKKTCHVIFGSDVALLAGDALLVEAFNMVNSIDTSPEIKIRMIQDMAILGGERGLIAGQMQDILTEGQKFTRKTVEFIHKNKTAKLLQIASRFGAYLAEVSIVEAKKVDEFAENLGLAFQITDDILDVEANFETLGKTAGKDEVVQKATYHTIIGLDKSRVLADKYTKAAIEILETYGDRAVPLIKFTESLLNRNK
jgi:geranylgeranyl diphosphate synthase type II